MSSSDEEAIVKCGTTKGDITMRFIREWSPLGYDRAVELYERHFYDHSHFFRAVPNFLVQFGISYIKDPETQALARREISDDPKHDPPIEFHPGIISFAGSGPNSRTSQMFISYGSSKSLGTELWETPIGRVVDGMDVATQFYSYGDMPPWGKGPVQGKIYNGPQYIEEGFPKIDKFLECTVKRIPAGNGKLKESRRLDEGEEEEESFDEDGESGDEGDHSGDEEEESEDVEEGEEEYEEEEEEDQSGDEEEYSSDESPDEEKEPEPSNLRLNADKFYASPQGMVNNRALGSGALSGDTNSLMFPVLVVLVMLALYTMLRGRKKESSKEN